MSRYSTLPFLIVTSAQFAAIHDLESRCNVLYTCKFTFDEMMWRIGLRGLLGGEIIRWMESFSGKGWAINLIVFNFNEPHIHRYMITGG